MTADSPAGTASTTTGAAAAALVRDADARLADVSGKSTTEQVAIFDEVHALLQRALAVLDES
ncbi:MAG: hypothetical protein ABR520_00280 [Mycobacteriales bacterium]|nr:hypothetical protein [Frankia sp.]